MIETLPQSDYWLCNFADFHYYHLSLLQVSAMTLRVAAGPLSPAVLHVAVLDFQFPVSSGPEAEAYAFCPDGLDQTFLLQMAELVRSFGQVVPHIHLFALVAAAVVVAGGPG